MTDMVRAAGDLLATEALYLDERRWDDWLGLCDDEIEFWVPAWNSAGDPTNDPETQISLIYASSRRQLEERVARLRSGRSAASSPLPRTVHLVSNLLVDGDDRSESVIVRSTVTIHVFDLRRRESTALFGRYEHELISVGRALRIRRKKVLVANDHFSTVLDFFTV
jgi:3-phenylpropionate/cinnamic acid dioxygenase small subunit